MLNFKEKQKNVSPKRVFVSYRYRGSKIGGSKKITEKSCQVKKKLYFCNSL